MKIYADVRKTLLYFFFLALILLLILYVTLSDAPFKSINTKDYLIFAGWFISTLVWLILTIIQSYYILDKKGLMQKRMTKTYRYEYKEIIYIDEEWSRKKKILLFVTNRGHVFQLIMDHRQVLLEEMLKRCKERKTLVEVKEQFPNIKW